MIRSVGKKPVYPQQDLADRLRLALDESGVTQAELARACGVTDQAVYKWLTTGRVGKQHLATICAMTGKSLDYLLVGLKMWRRVAALALPLVLVPQLGELVSTQAFAALRQFAYVLCKIARDQLSAVRSLTEILHSTAFDQIEPAR